MNMIIVSKVPNLHFYHLSHPFALYFSISPPFIEFLYFLNVT